MEEKSLNYQDKIITLLRLAIRNEIIVDLNDFMNKEKLALLSEKKIYSFKFNKNISKSNNREYKIVFNNSYKPSEKGYEYLKRGSIFVNDLLKKIFETYNILFVNKAKYINNEMPPEIYVEYLCRSQLLETKDDDSTNKDYRYQLGLLVEIKDTIDGVVTNKKILESLLLTFNNNVLEYDSITNIVHDDDEKEANDDDLSAYNIGDMIENLISLSESLDKKEEKERIFNNLRKNENRDITKHIEQRQLKAKQNGVIDVRFEYNVMPITVYVNQVLMKKATYRISKNQNFADFSFVYDPANPKQYKHICPNCGQTYDPSSPLRLAKDLNGVYHVCCGFSHCCYAAKNINQVYLFDSENYLPECVDLAYNNGVEQSFLKKDIFTCAITKQKYYINERMIPDYLVSSKGKITKNTQKTEVHKSLVYQCAKCGKSYALSSLPNSSLENDLIKLNVIFRITDEQNSICCVECRKNYFISQIPNSAYNTFSSPRSAEICAICGRVGYNFDFINVLRDTELHLCNECYNKHRNIFDEIRLNNKGISLNDDSELSQAIWNIIKNDVTLSLSKKENCIYNSIDISESQNKIILLRIRNHIYHYFYIDNQLTLFASEVI